MSVVGGLVGLGRECWLRLIGLGRDRRLCGFDLVEIGRVGLKLVGLVETGRA